MSHMTPEHMKYLEKEHSKMVSEVKDVLDDYCESFYDSLYNGLSMAGFNDTLTGAFGDICWRIDDLRSEIERLNRKYDPYYYMFFLIAGISINDEGRAETQSLWDIEEKFNDMDAGRDEGLDSLLPREIVYIAEMVGSDKEFDLKATELLDWLGFEEEAKLLKDGRSKQVIEKWQKLINDDENKINKNEEKVGKSTIESYDCLQNDSRGESNNSDDTSDDNEEI